MATRKINTFIQHLMEYYEQGPEDPMTGRPTMTYAGKHDDLDHSELTQMQSDHKAEIEPFFKSPDDFKSFDAHIPEIARSQRVNSFPASKTNECNPRFILHI